MILTHKVNRLEYITRMGFDNTDEEKKQLMNYFSKLDRASVLGADELTALRKENAELVKFVEAFLDNFTDCETCGASGWDYVVKDNCHKCHGTGETIDSIGVLYVDLPEMARALISKHKG